MQFDLGPSLADQRAQALAQIDKAAEAARLRYITPGAGQALEYQATEVEARRFLSEGGEPASYPFLLAEWEARGQVETISEVAQSIVAQADAWAQIGSEIKRIRRSAKLAVEAATNHPAIRQIVDNLNWP